MKIRNLLAFAVAGLALAGCNRNKNETQGTPVSNETATITQATPPAGGNWSDVVNVDRSSIGGGTVAGFPRGAPITLHTLASLMISISDNTATDILLHVVGRENVERMMAAMGVRDPARNRPLLSTTNG